jgi:UDP-N-acetylglucosamine diphosphorylase/glucosamine-1-phosphate N-acetyltransferase
MNCIFFDDNSWDNLLPLTYTRPLANMRCGILTIAEKWQKIYSSTVSYLTRDYLAEKFPVVIKAENFLINGALLPDATLVDRISSLKEGQLLTSKGIILAACLKEEQVEAFKNSKTDGFQQLEYTSSFTKISYPWDIFTFNDKAIRDDFRLLTNGRTSARINESNKIIGEENIFLEEGASVNCAIINASTGPVYVGKDAEIMEGSIVRGPLSLCEHSALKMGAKVYGATTIGPHSKVGGELSNSVIFGYSNKAHDGFLGNAVLGEWCNLGADTNNSNLKNNYAIVKVWNYPQERFINTGLQFCGLIMGDHSKSGINTMFNTGTVVGVSANIFGAGFPRNFVPSFSWGGPQGFMVYTVNKAFEVAEQVYKRRSLEFTAADKLILEKVFALSEKYRKF